MSDRTEFARAVRTADVGEATRLRGEVRGWLAGLDMSDEARDRVLAAASEAVDNAVEHAYRDRPGDPGATEGPARTVELTLWSEADAVNVSVVDHGVWHDPAPPAATGSPAPRGRGFVIMQRSVDSVIIHHGHDGTAVALRHHRDG